MKRRTIDSDDAGGPDALLDTMTNVVGILIIMLIVTQLQVSDAVERIKGFVEDIPEEEVAAAETRSAELNELISDETEEWQELSIDEDKRKLSIAEQKRLIDNLKRDLEKLADSNVDPAQLKKEIDARKKEVAKLEADINNKDKRLASLKAQLASTPSGPDPDAKVVNLPNPRPAPKGAQAFDMLCVKGRVMPIYESRFLSLCQRKVAQRRRAIATAQGLVADKLIEIFESDPVEDAYFKVKITIINNIPHIDLIPKKDAGEETARVLAGGQSQYRGWIRQLNKAQSYIRFRVCTDSFETYLAARNVAAQQRYLAGWLPYGTGYTHRVRLDKGFKYQGKDQKLVCVGYKPPPPAPKPPAGAAAKPSRPALPTPAID